jgi:diacylglycerol O-acyltransferase-1
VYQPLLDAGWTRSQAQLVVFLLSAFFHELLVGVPLRMFKLWFCFGVLG